MDTEAVSSTQPVLLLMMDRYISYTLTFKSLGSVRCLIIIFLYFYRGCIKLIKSDSKGIYDVTEDFYLK